MASDGEDFDDLEALRQAALDSLAIKPKAKTELPPSSRKADDDEDLTALREAALRSTKVHSAPVARDRPVVEQRFHPIPQHHHRPNYHQRHPRHHSRQQYPYDSTRRNGDRSKYHYSRNRSNNLNIVPFSQRGRNSIKGLYRLDNTQKSGNNLEVSDNKSLLLPQDKWAGKQLNTSENKSSTADGNPKRRKDGKFSRYDDSESDEDSGSDSDMLSLSSESQLNKDECSDSENSVTNQSDTRIVKHDETKEIVIQKAVSDNLELEATGDNLEIQDKDSSDSLLEDFEEPLLDIQENGVIDESFNSTMDTSDKQVIDEAFSIELLPSESLDLEEPECKEVLEARKKKFETTEEIKDLKKTISLKGIIPKSRKRHRRSKHHRHHREEKLSHSSHKEELHSRDLKERNSDKEEDLPLKPYRTRDYSRPHNRYSSGSSRSSDDGCQGGSFSDGAGQRMQLKGTDMTTGQSLRLKRTDMTRVGDLRMKTSRSRDFQRHRNRNDSRSPRSSDDGYQGGSFSDSTGQPIRLKGTDIGISNRFSQRVSQYRENQRRVVQERSPLRNSSRDTRYPLLGTSDSGEDNENSMLKKRSLSSVVRTSPKPKRHKSRKVLDSDRDNNFQKDPYLSDSKAKQSARGWAAMIENRSKARLTNKDDPNYHGNPDNLELEEQLEKIAQVNFVLEYDEGYPAKKVDDRLSVHQRLGLTSKTKLEVSETSTEKPKKTPNRKEQNICGSF